ncbi:MAG: PLDc N-terminal domain-containing protein [Desulfamplus sp.]|nr:PLDc N-terminal domain-containing protein [Desulfamplus sp.]
MDNTFIVVAGMGVVFWGLTILAIVNVILKDFGSMQSKVIWGLVALTPFVGWIVYFLFGAKRGVRKKG